MRAAIYPAFVPWTKAFEGYCTHMYLDVRGLVTIGYGNLVDPISLTAGLDFRRPSGLQCTPSEVSAAWLTVKNRQDLRKAGGGAYAQITTIRATETSITKLCNTKLDEIERVLKGVFPDWDNWPADAQLGALSIAWAAGPHTFATGWPKFTAAANAGNWVLASLNCHMADFANPGLRPRNAANVKLFEAAAVTKTPDLLT